MWTPKQLLTDEAVEALRHAGYTPLEIEFLGWQTGRAGAINKSPNPAKAAATCLSNEATPRMIEVFKRK